MQSPTSRRSLFLAGFLLMLPGVADAQSESHHAAHSTPDCAYRPPAEWVADMQRAASQGKIADPRLRAIPQIPTFPSTGSGGMGSAPCIRPEQLFAFEDTNQLLLTNFATGELLDLMAEAANDLLATHGDNFDFVGFWINFTPHHQIGGAFYLPIENDVQGIGDASTIGTPIFNMRPDMGIAGENIEGFVMMWNINNSLWQPGSGPSASTTRLVLGQEFEHRFAMFLPDLLDGRPLQGDNGICGRQYHWNWKVDGQGSGMEISEWEGSNPAVRSSSSLNFNSDIAEGVFSYTDLYLMGYVSPAEMDAGNSELRYMDSSDCSSNYFGPISQFSSAEVVASAGARIPDSTTAQQDFRTGWIMIHLPGDVPSGAERDKAVAILEQHQSDWNSSTLGRGTMNNTAFDDCNCNGIPDSTDIAGGGSTDLNTNGVPDECECVTMSYCEGAANSVGPGASIGGTGSLSIAANDFTITATGAPPGQTGLFYYGPDATQAPFGEGFRCVDGGGIGVFRLNPPVVIDGGGSAFAPVDFTQPPAGSGPGEITALSTWRLQFWYRDPAGGGTGFNLSDALEATFCP